MLVPLTAIRDATLLRAGSGVVTDVVARSAGVAVAHGPPRVRHFADEEAPRRPTHGCLRARGALSTAPRQSAPRANSDTLAEFAVTALRAVGVRLLGFDSFQESRDESAARRDCGRVDVVVRIPSVTRADPLLGVGLGRGAIP